MTLLSICIPTYKRPEKLRRCIDSAFESAQGRPLQVVVADDSVSDVNDGVLHELQRTHAGIAWHRNEVNLGIDRNIQKAIDLAQGDYCWLIGEDDLFLPGAIARMYDRLQACADRFVFANYEFANEDFSRIVGRAYTGEVEDLPTDTFIADFLWTVGFIGSTVVRRDAWLSDTSPTPYTGTYFTHVGRVLDLIASQPRVLLCKEPSIANRSQGADTFTWKHDSFGVFFGFERMCRVAAEIHPSLAPALQRAIATYRKRAGYLSIKSTFRLRSQGAFDLRQYRTYIEAAQIARSTKVWLRFLALTPRPLLLPMAHLYQWSTARLADFKSRGAPGG